MRGMTTMNIGACVGLKETLAANRPGGGNNDRYQFIGKNFFEGENYRAALERLDGGKIELILYFFPVLSFFFLGYDVSMDFIEWMQDYCDNEREQARNLISYAEKWTTRLKQQPSLVSYHTTKRAQLNVVGITKELARLKESTCNDIQKVIEKYRNYINETYISERFRPGRKHCRTHEFKKLFKSAYASVREVSSELERLCTQEKKAREAVRNADSACEILELDPTTSEKQLARANDVQTKKRALLTDIEQKIIETKERQKVAQKAYRIKATEIFKQCQYVEEERLEQMRETLLDFIQAMYTQKYASELTDIFEGLTNKITTEQNSFDDLMFWAKTYGIENKLTKSLTFAVNDEDENIIESRPTKKSTHHENDAEEDEPSAATSSTTPAKTKIKRTRNTTTVDKKNINTTEPSTTNNNMLNHV